MKLPGIIYSLLLAIGTWAVDYFTSGAGAGFPWAPVLVAAVPIIIKLLVPGDDTPEATARAMGHARSYASRVLWG